MNIKNFRFVADRRLDKDVECIVCGKMMNPLKDYEATKDAPHNIPLMENNFCSRECFEKADEEIRKTPAGKESISEGPEESLPAVKFDIQIQYQGYLNRMKLDESKMSFTQFQETKNAFMGALSTITAFVKAYGMQGQQLNWPDLEGQLVAFWDDRIKKGNSIIVTPTQQNPRIN